MKLNACPNLNSDFFCKIPTGFFSTYDYGKYFTKIIFEHEILPCVTKLQELLTNLLNICLNQNFRKVQNPV